MCEMDRVIRCKEENIYGWGKNNGLGDRLKGLISKVIYERKRKK